MHGDTTTEDVEMWNYVGWCAATKDVEVQNDIVWCVRHWIFFTQEKNKKITKSEMELFWSLSFHKRYGKHKNRKNDR